MKMHFFGCSFTEGGGLDNFDYFNYNTGKNYNIDDNIAEQFEEIRIFKEENRYSSVVGRILGIDVKNYAIGCNSNEAILKKVFEVVNDSETTKDDIFIVQTSIYARKFYWYEPIQDFISANASQKGDWPFRNMDIWMPLHKLHNLNLKYTHNEQYEIDKLFNNMELYNAYFKEKGIKIFWTPWPDMTLETYSSKIEEVYKKLLEKFPNIILYDGGCMGKLIGDNKLQIKDVFTKSNDSHKSLEGHRLVGEKIAEYLKNKL